MAKKDMLVKIGVWGFIAGVLIALIVGIISGLSGVDSQTMGLVSAVMLILGLIVGALNVTEDEVTDFVIVAIGLLVAANAIAQLGDLLGVTIGPMVKTAFSIFGSFVAAAIVIPALKAVYKIAKDQ